MSLHECKIYDSSGTLKDTIGLERISKDYWDAFSTESAEYVTFDYTDADEGVNLSEKIFKRTQKKRLYTIECSFCKKTVKAIRRHAKFCSPQCKGEAAYAIKKARLEKAAGRRYTIQCKICEKKWQATKSYSKYCSAACRKESRHLLMRRTGEQIKTNLAQRKLEIDERKEKIFQREREASLKRSEAREAHSV